MGTNLNLTPEAGVESGRFNNIGEVVRSGLRMLQEAEERRSALVASPITWQLHAHAGDAEGTGAVVADYLREKRIKIGAKVAIHGRYVTFQSAEIAMSQQMFAEISWLIARLCAPPAPA
jgi:Arc/MetJ-type ribon-helix-helix transcriptional regulator